MPSVHPNAIASNNPSSISVEFAAKIGLKWLPAAGWLCPGPRPPTMARIDTVQTLRAIAALSVCLAHALGDIKTRVFGVELVPGYYLGAAGVDLFFVVSGFVMTFSTRELGSDRSAWAPFLLRRWIRVAPLYWLATAVYAAMLVTQGKPELLQPGRLLGSALFWPMPAPDGSMSPLYGVGWTLNFEMFFYAVFALAIWATGARAAWATALGLGVLMAANQTLTLPTPLGYLLNPIVLDFVFGILLAKAYDRGWTIAPVASWALGTLAVGAIVAGGFAGYVAGLPEQPSSALRWAAWGLPMAALAASVVLARPATAPVSAARQSALRLLGDASYSIYLMHPIVIILMRPLGVALADTLGAGHIAVASLYLCVVIGTVIALSMLVFSSVEKPITARLRGLLKPRTRATIRQPNASGGALALKDDSD